MTDEIRIVEYASTWAKSLAKMWNCSADSWGGNSAVVTEENVREENENSANLNTYLAIDGEEVVGYCSFSEYREDDGAMYIPLLNVRPDYHGKKVGKALVLHVLRRTIELGWPRLDLYTWPGNTKAVPVYKKCGFFWEKREDATHLMNFIPTVLATEAAAPFFQQADWYEDSQRAIEVIPDGRTEMGLEIFAYVWEKNGRHLRMEFERSGRGLRLIETDEYRVVMALKGKDFVFGRRYPVVFEIQNKTMEPIEISIQGKDDKNIAFDLEQTVRVENTVTVEGMFTVGEILEEQSHWKTHPGVCADITINGRHAAFKVGIQPKFPAKMGLNTPRHALQEGAAFEVFLELENNFDVPATFSFELSDNDLISFSQNDFEVLLGLHQRKAIPIQCTLKKNGFFEHCLLVRAALESGEQIIFEKRLTAIFQGVQGLFGGETDWGYMVAGGGYTVCLNKHNNDINMGHISGDEYGSFLMCPKLGIPFNLEFVKKRPVGVTYRQLPDGMEMCARYQSQQYPGIDVISHISISLNGIVLQYFEVINTSTEDMEKDLWIQRGVFHDLFRGILPYENGYVGMKASPGGSYSLWDSGKVTENWIFSRSDKMPRGICWDPKDKPKFNEWHMVFEHNFGKLKAGEGRCTRNITLSFGTFQDWQCFRAFAIKASKSQENTLEDSLSIRIHADNPFIQGGLDVAVRSFVQESFNGSIHLTSDKGSFPESVVKFREEGGLREAELMAKKLPSSARQDILAVKVDLDTMCITRSAAVFFVDGDAVDVSPMDDGDISALRADNGVIRIKAASKYAHALYSLQYNGREWLDSPYPQPGPKSWWNPWLGGIATQPQEITNLSLMKEPRWVEPAECMDNRGNLWRGIQIRTEITEQEKFKGLVQTQYYLMLPGVPVVCCTTEIVQNTGTYFNHIPFMTMAFIKSGDDIKQSCYTIRNRDGSMMTYKAGRVRQDIKADGPVLYHSDTRDEKLLVVNNPAQSFMEAITNNQVMGSIHVNKVSVRDGERMFLPPVFLVFAEAYPEEGVLKDLLGIRFSPACPSDPIF